MPYHHLVMTAGISAFGSKNLGRAWLDARFSERISWHGPTIDAPESDRARLLAEAKTAALLPVVDPTTVCAEVSLLHAMRHERLLTAHPTVDLVHSETFPGVMAATFAARVLETLDTTVRCHPIADLDAERPEAMRRSLGTYMGRLAQCFDGADPRTTCFAPIGGYKVMSSLGTLTGSLLGYDTRYLHEVGQRLVRIPAVPLDVRPEGLVRVRPLFWRIRDEDVSARSKLAPDERDLLDEYPWIFDRQGEDADEMISVSPFAELLLATKPHKKALQRQVFVERHLKASYDPPILREAADALLDELQGARRGELLHHEREFKHGTTLFHAYKTRTDGRFRLIWRSPSPDRVEIREAWIDDHRAYERAVADGAVLSGVSNLVWVALD